MAAENLSRGQDDGTSFGLSTTDPISFYAVTPIVQPSGSAMATLDVTIATADSGFMFATSAGFNAAIAQITELRNTLVELGLHAGS